MLITDFKGYKKSRWLKDFEKMSIYSIRLDQLEEYLVSIGEKKFRAKQIYDWLYKKRITSFTEMKNVPKSLQEKLAEEFEITTLNTIIKQESIDGTMKFLFELQDKYTIESVLMKNKYGNSLCVTTQVGCRIGCTFCASTLGGLKRNLEAGEIVSQVLKVQQELDKRGERISSIVIMGIGEPFENYDEMMDFIKIVNSDESFNIGARHITVSTSGIVPKIYDFANEKIQINFAVSLHAPTNELRSKIMPVNRAYNIDKLMEALKYYQKTTNRRITFEYGLMGKVNDQREHAEKLSEIIKDLNCHVNLIPINYVPERNYVRTSKNDIFAFEKVLKKNRVNVTIRRTQGDDIDAACGQLRAKERKDEVKGGIPDATSIKLKNEDAVSVVKNKQGEALAIICDGVGSHSNAAYSSNYIVSTLEKDWQNLTFANFNNMKNWLYDKIEKLNKELFEKSKSKNKKMGTTIVAVATFDDQVVVYNIGDSRAYGITSDNEMSVVTIEDSFVGALIHAGVITEEEAKTHPEKHVLTQALATRERIDLHTFIDDLSKYDYFLICSDGLTNMLDEEEIKEIIRQEELSIAVEKLINLSVERGGVDNISVAILKNLRGDNSDK